MVNKSRIKWINLPSLGRYGACLCMPHAGSLSPSPYGPGASPSFAGESVVMRTRRNKSTIVFRHGMTGKVFLLLLLAFGCGYSVAADEPLQMESDSLWRNTESVALDLEASFSHVIAAFFGANYRFGKIEFYSTMRAFETFHFDKDTVGDFGLLSSSLTGVAFTRIIIAAFQDSGMSNHGVDRILITAPYLLNPEIRYLGNQLFKPYLGLSGNLVYRNGFKPVAAARVGIIFDHFKSQVRIRGGYEIIRMDRKIESSIQIGLAFGITSDL